VYAVILFLVLLVQSGEDPTSWLWSHEVHVCAVCGRVKTTNRYLALRFTRITPSPATVYCDRVLGEHKHIWVFDESVTLMLIADGVAGSRAPLHNDRVFRALVTLDGSPFLEPVVKALCDVDNRFSQVAQDALVSWPPPLPPDLQAWWEENNKYFRIVHDQGKSLEALERTYLKEDSMDLPGTADQTNKNPR
jgi:hypothetical protein